MGTGWGRRVSGVLAAGALLAVAQVPVAWADDALAIEPGEITVTNAPAGSSC